MLGCMPYGGEYIESIIDEQDNIRSAGEEDELSGVCFWHPDI